jgi:hypothetical protein
LALLVRISDGWVGASHDERTVVTSEALDRLFEVTLSHLNEVQRRAVAVAVLAEDSEPDAPGHPGGPRNRRTCRQSRGLPGTRGVPHLRPQRLHPGERPAAWGTQSCRRGDLNSGKPILRWRSLLTVSLAQRRFPTKFRVVW